MIAKILSLLVFLAVSSDVSSTLEIAFVLTPGSLMSNDSTTTLVPINTTTTGPPPTESTTTTAIVKPTTANATKSTEPVVTTNSTTATKPPTTENGTTTVEPPTTVNTTTATSPLTTINTTTATSPLTTINTTTATSPPFTINTTTATSPTTTNTTTATYPTTASNVTTTTEPPTTANATTTTANATTTTANATTTTANATTAAVPTTANSTTWPPTPPVTTTEKPITTAKPVADYSVEENGTICIRVRGDISFHVPYMSNKTTAFATVNLPAVGGTVMGQCFGKVGTHAGIHIFWDNQTCVFVLGFELHSDGSWRTVNMSYSFDTRNPVFKSPDKIGEITGALVKASDADMYRAASNKSYSCDREDKITLSNQVVVKFSHFQMQPITFYGTDFNKAELCSAPSDDNTTSSVVPIAVGCALAGLIVIVLIAYLIGRRRSNRGYQHV